MIFDLRDHILALIEEQDFAEAVRRLDQLVLEEPDDAGAFAIRALCLAELERWRDAEASASRATLLDPDTAFHHRVLAQVLTGRGDFRPALAAAREAVALEPDEPDHHVLVGRIEGAQGRWDAALRTVEHALALDPEHEDGLRLRALILQVRGRAEEADSAFLNALIRDPGDAFAYAGRGWSMLRTGGDARDAAAHFERALHIAPDSEWAREGLVAALKARNPVYRQILRFFLWMGSLSARTRMLVVFGGLFGFNVLRRTAAANPALAPLIWPVLALWLLFVLLSWTADPLFDSLLRLDPVGRRALTPDRVLASNLVLATLAAALALAGASVALDAPRAGLAAFVFGFLVLPVAGTFRCEPGWPRRTMAVLTAIIALLGIGVLAAGEEEAGLLTGVALLLTVASTWLNGWLATVTPRRRG
ncbi:MAG TPA: tetratricopeptide repeat protein [Longimicrobiaceae bacterium]|nr:tetratricopeptide repeat protein [Longimicrobiaceae bacterium]